MIVPERVLVRPVLNFSYRVENKGAGATPARQTRWADRVYLSADAFLDLNADRYPRRGQSHRRAGCRGQLLRRPANLRLPRESRRFATTCSS